MSTNSLHNSKVIRAIRIENNSLNIYICNINKAKLGVWSVALWSNMFGAHEAKIEVKFWAVGGCGHEMAVGVWLAPLKSF